MTKEDISFSTSGPTTNQLSPSLVVPRLKAGQSADREAWHNVSDRMPAVPLLKWFPGGDPAAEPTGEVKMGWSGTSIHILADLGDDYIFTRATRFNEPLYLLGDCFEIFLQVKGSESYLEFHVAPNNLVFQLLYPSPADFTKYRTLPTEEFHSRFTLPEPAFTSQTWPSPDEQRWSLAASIDLRVLVPSLTTLAQIGCRFHFGRYDYPPGGGDPVLSCSSVLQRLDFHVLEDWGTLHFEN